MTKGISKNQQKILKIVFSAILAGIALVVGYIEIRWPIAPWLKLDFSEVVILISLLLVGFNHTFGIIIIRSVIRWLITADSTNVPFPFFGELVAIIASLMVVLVYLLLNYLLKDSDYPQSTYRKKPYQSINDTSKKIIKDIIKVIVGTLILTAFMILINFFVVTPSFASQGEYPFFTTFVQSGKYDGMFGGGFKNYTIFVISIYGPFNLLKFASCFSLFMLIKRPLLKTIDLRP